LFLALVALGLECQVSLLIHIVVFRLYFFLFALSLVARSSARLLYCVFFPSVDVLGWDNERSLRLPLFFFFFSTTSSSRRCLGARPAAAARGKDGRWRALRLGLAHGSHRREHRGLMVRAGDIDTFIHIWV
jgi:hypothetical protein